MKRKYIVILLMILSIIIISYFFINYRTMNFESITGITIDNIDKIVVGDKIIYENYDELILLFNSYEYKRLFSNNFDFEQEFPDGLKTYTIVIYSNDNPAYIHPTGNKVLINNRLYIVNKEIDHKFLTEFYESIDYNNTIR